MALNTVAIAVIVRDQIQKRPSTRGGGLPLAVLKSGGTHKESMRTSVVL